MPLRMVLDAGSVRVEDTLLLGARSLDPPEEAFIAASGIRTDERDLEEVIAGVDAVYVAFDVDVLDPGEDVAGHMAEPGGPTLAEAVATLERIARSGPVAGAGFSGGTADPRNAAPIARLAAALGL
jgi:arginase